MKPTSLLLIIAIGAGGLYACERLKRDARPPPPGVDAPVVRDAPVALHYERPWGQQADQLQPVTGAARYTCDGREHCSQMRSCAEARYFLQNCPNTKMDGDRDGIPCESQWCN